MSAEVLTEETMLRAELEQARRHYDELEAAWKKNDAAWLNLLRAETRLWFMHGALAGLAAGIVLGIVLVKVAT